jgi:hypothetical protein
LLLFAAVSFLIKEDGVMLLPAIAALHAIRRRVADRALPPVPPTFAVLAVVWIVLLIAVRFAALESLGGYGRPTVALAWQRVWNTLHGIFRLVPPDRDWQPAASWFATALPLLAAAAWRWVSRDARLLLTSGAALAVIFVLPFVFAAKAEQVYLIGLGAVLVLTGAVAALLDLARRARAPGFATAAVLAIVAAGATAFAMVARDITRDFAPFGPMVLSHDDIVRTWSSVPPEVHAYLAAKRGPGAADRLSANPIDELAHVSFGFHGLETSPDGVRYLWMAGPRVEIHVSAAARTVSIPLRHEIGAFREAARAFVAVDGRPAGDLRLEDGGWHRFTTVLQPERASRRMHRIEIRIDHAWRPAQLIPGSADPRVLGLQVGEITLR